MRRSRPLQSGFTLVELIVVIAVTGILAGIVAMFIRNPIEAYMTSTRRAEMVDIANTAMLRMARDVRTAVPNSLRVTTSGSVVYLEFLPVADGGRYRAELAIDGSGNISGNILDFADGNDASFDVLGPTVTAAAGQYLVIYNLGLDSDTDAWQGGNRRTVTSTGSVSTLAFTATGARLPLESPGQRFFLANAPVTYVCDPAARTLTRRWGYTLAANQPTSFTDGDSALLATRVSACNFTYDVGASQRMGQVTLFIRLENSDGDNTEGVSLYREVAVNNDA